MRCNICDTNSFRDYNGRKLAMCANCGSLERTRLLKLHFEDKDVRPEMRVLHLAPERGLSMFFSQRVAEYVPADYDVARYRNIENVRFVDLTKPDTYESLGKFDIILHCHVLEHIRYNYAALLLKLHKMLKPGGIHAFSVPIHGQHYGEHWGPLSAEEATERFGQFDHIRRFSAADIDKTLGSMFSLPSTDLAKKFGSAALLEHNIPEKYWTGLNSNSIFWLRSEDCLI